MQDAIGLSFESEFAADVFSFLGSEGQKSVPSKHLYDAAGNALFQRIAQMPGYGLIRAEEHLLAQHGGELAEKLRSKLRVAQLGNTAGSQSQHLLNALRPRLIPYHPIDAVAELLEQCVQKNETLEHVWISPVQADKIPGMIEVASQRRAGEQLLVLFPGAAIGNFYPEMAVAFLRSIRRQMSAGDVLILGADLEKPIEPMLAAYDDNHGLCAALHLNLLTRMNRELNADFDPAQFEHVAIFNRESRSVETHIRAKEPQVVSIPKAELVVEFRQGETIRTESNRKYSSLEVLDLAAASGFHREEEWVDEGWGFSENLLRAA